MSMTPVPPESIPELSPRIHFGKVIFPVILAGMSILLVVAGVLRAVSTNAAGSEQLSIIGNVMLTCFVLCPLVLCTTIVYLLLLAVILGLNKVNGTAQKSCQLVGQQTRKLADQTDAVADTLNRKSIDFSARFAFLEIPASDPEANTQSPESDHVADK